MSLQQTIIQAHVATLDTEIFYLFNGITSPLNTRFVSPVGIERGITKAIDGHFSHHHYIT